MTQSTLPFEVKVWMFYIKEKGIEGYKRYGLIFRLSSKDTSFELNDMRYKASLSFNLKSFENPTCVSIEIKGYTKSETELIVYSEKCNI